IHGPKGEVFPPVRCWYGTGLVCAPSPVVYVYGPHRVRIGVPVQSPNSLATAQRSKVSEQTSSSAVPRTRKATVLLVMVLGLMTAMGPLATDMYLPAFPQITEALGTAEAQVQLTLTAMMLGLSLGQLVIGPMSDAWGRRGPLLVGGAVFTVTSVLCVFVPNVTVFIVLRFVQGVSGAAGAVIALAVVRDLFKGDSAVRYTPCTNRNTMKTVKIGRAHV